LSVPLALLAAIRIHLVDLKVSLIGAHFCFFDSLVSSSFYMGTKLLNLLKAAQCHRCASQTDYS